MSTKKKDRLYRAASFLWSTRVHHGEQNKMITIKGELGKKKKKFWL